MTKQTCPIIYFIFITLTRRHLWARKYSLPKKKRWHVELSTDLTRLICSRIGKTRKVLCLKLDLVFEWAKGKYQSMREAGVGDARDRRRFICMRVSLPKGKSKTSWQCKESCLLWDQRQGNRAWRIELVFLCRNYPGCLVYILSFNVFNNLNGSRMILRLF